MKSFIKYTLASLLALVLFTVVTMIIGLVSLAGMMASDGMTPSVKNNTILRINLSGDIAEQTQDIPFASLMGGGPPERLSGKGAPRARSSPPWPAVP